MEDSVILDRAKVFLAQYQFSPDDVKILATLYMDRIRCHRAKKFREADMFRQHLMNFGVNVNLADDQIL